MSVVQFSVHVFGGWGYGGGGRTKEFDFDILSPSLIPFYIALSIDSDRKIQEFASFCKNLPPAQTGCILLKLKNFWFYGFRFVKRVIFLF